MLVGGTPKSLGDFVPRLFFLSISKFVCSFKRNQNWKSLSLTHTHPPTKEPWQSTETECIKFQH